MGDSIKDAYITPWWIDVAVTNGLVRIQVMEGTPGQGGKIFLDQDSTRQLMVQLQAAHVYNNWQPYPELYF